MGKKYIIELNPDCVEGEYLRIPARIAGEQQWLVTKAALTPCAELDLVQLRKEAYAEGYKEGMQLSIDDAKLKEEYQQGLNDAWEAVGKIYNMCSDVRHKIFKENLIRKILSIYSASEAIEKIQQYEQEQDAEIKVGDEVVGVFSDGKETRPFVFMRGTQEYYFGMYSDTEEFCRTVRLNLRKTGRSFPEIAAVLEKMRGDQE